RHEIEGHKSAVDGDALWAQIQPQLQEDRKRRYPFWLWWWALGIGILLAAAIFHLQRQAPVSVTATAADPITTEEVSSAPVDQLKQTQAEGTTLEGKEANGQNENAIAQMSSSQPEETSAKAALVPATETRVVNASSANRPPTVPKSEGGIVNSSSPKTTAKNVLPVALAEKSTKNQKLSQVIPLLSTPSIPLLPSQALSLGLKPSPKMTKQGGEEENLLARGAFQRNISWGLGVRGGLLKSIRQLETRQDNAADYLQRRKETEEQLETFDLGLDVYLRHKSGFYARTGFNFTRAAERFAYNSVVTERDSIDGVVKIIYNTSGDSTDEVRGKVGVTRRTEYRRTVYNSIQWLDLPLVAGYTFSAGESPLQMSVEGGVHINLALMREGTFFAPEGDQVLDFGEDDFFESSLGVGFYAGFALYYEVAPSWQVGIQPHFRYYPSDISNGDYVLRQRYSLMGVNASVRVFLD
ncbi:MAG: hypothetical protein AAFV25_05725, partial [Bacteroidota bacterium]